MAELEQWATAVLSLDTRPCTLCAFADHSGREHAAWTRARAKEADRVQAAEYAAQRKTPWVAEQGVG